MLRPKGAYFIVKSQVLTTLLNNPKIHPELAFTHCGLFLDPESAYLQSRQWWEEQERAAKEAAKETEPTPNPDNPDADANTDTEDEEGTEQ